MRNKLYEKKKEEVKAEPEEYFSDGVRRGKMIIKESVKKKRLLKNSIKRRREI